MKIFRELTAVSISLLVLTVSYSGAAAAADLQEMIDAALPGSVVTVPAGIYRGNFDLKPGVILAGSGAGDCTLDAGDGGPVITARGGGIIKGITVRGGIEGIKSGPGLIGVFDCVITGNKGDGIRSAPGGCILVNNIIQSPVALSLARSHGLAINNTIRAAKTAIHLWKTSEVKAVNNRVFDSPLMVEVETDTAPVLENNIVSAPVAAVAAATENNLVIASGLDPSVYSGIPVEGIPERITAVIGSSLPETLTVEECRKVMELAERDLCALGPVVVYRLLDEAGYFEVVTRFPSPEFIVTSSTEKTPISEVEAYDAVKEEVLNDRLVYDEPPAVEVTGWSGIDYAEEADRYAMESVFYQPDSYRIDELGNLYFQRETNFARIEIVIPEGYRVERLVPETEIEPDADSIVISNPEQTLISIGLILSPII